MSDQKQTHVSEAKKRIVENLMDLIKNKKTILIASIKNIPASQFQEIAKKLRGKAIVKVPKKNLIFKAVDDAGNETVKQLKEKITDSVAVLFSDVDSFELAAELTQNKSPVKAKPGQEAPEDISVPAGPTELLPGPAISELGALGIQVQIENGKITIREPKVIAKQGENISSGAADVMNKLDIKPFSVGFVPLAAFDSKEGKLYTEINIDKEQTVEELKQAFGRALPFAVEIGYATNETISFLIGKAGVHGKALEKFAGEEKKEEEKGEEKGENAESQSDSEDKEVVNEETKSDEPKSEEVKEEEKDSADADEGEINPDSQGDEVKAEVSEPKAEEVKEEKVEEKDAEADASEDKEVVNEETKSDDVKAEVSEPVEDKQEDAVSENPANQDNNSENPSPIGEVSEKPSDSEANKESNQTPEENKSDGEENK